MAKQHLLIVDSDPKSLRVLEVSLKKAGFSVTRASNGLDAIEKIQISVPDMIITETAMPEMNGFEMIKRLKERSEWQDIPVIFLTAQKSIEDKIRGLEQGVEDYLTKPIFIREILARVSLVMQRRQRERLETRGSKTEFSGNLSDMGIIDLIQTIDISQKSGVIHVDREGDAGDIYFRNGKVVDAATASRKGEEAVYRMLVWSEGHFHIEFKHVDRTDEITLSTQGLLMEGMRRLDEWGRLQEQLPSLNSVFDIDDQLLAERLGEIPDEINTLLKQFNGKRSLMEVVNLCPLGDLEALTIITKLYFEGLIYDMGINPADEDSDMDSDTTGDTVGDTDDSIGTPEQAEKSTWDPDSDTNTDQSSDETLGDDDLTEPDSNVNGEPSDNRALEESRQNRISNSPPSVSSGKQRTLPPSAPIAPTVSNQSSPSQPPNRPNTGEYDLSLMTAGSRESTKQSVPGPAILSEQQTMMMHVSKTPTNPPPSPGSPKAAALAPQLRDSETLSPEPIAAAQSAVTPSEQPRQVAEEDEFAQSTDFDELVQSSAHIDTTLPTDIISDTEPDVIDDISDAEQKADAAPSPAPGLHIESGQSTNAEDTNIEKLASNSQSNEDDSQTSPDVSTADTASEPDAVADSQTAENSADASEDEDEEDEEDEDGWAELENATTKKYIKKILVAAIAVILLAGAAVLWWKTDFLRESSSSKTTAVTTAKPQPSRKPASPSNQPSASQTKSSSSSQAASKKQTEMKDKPADQLVDAASQPDTSQKPAAETALPTDSDSSALATETPVLTDEAKLAAYKKLMKKANSMGRAKKIKVLEEAIAIHPNGVDALTEYAIATMESRRLQSQALTYARRAAALEPQNAKAWLAIGYIHQLKNETEKSIEAYKKCAECSGPPEYVRNCKLLAR